MKIMDKIFSIAKKSKAKVLIGVGETEDQVIRAVNAAKKAIDEEYAKVTLMGKHQTLKKYKDEFDIFMSSKPEEDMVRALIEHDFDAAVRGSLGASKILLSLKEKLNLSKVFRLALLESANGQQFFFAPVGIDEGENIGEKLVFVEEGVNLVKALGLEPKVAIISGGRRDDIGRSPRVDRMLADSEFVVSVTKDKGITNNIKHYEILIENAMKENANIIIAPDGISGNLMYRTLIHLGGGKSHGAPFLKIDIDLVDTSRAGPISEYVSSIAFASALKDLRKKKNRNNFYSQDI
ncbi:MAG: methanogenesis marker protein Mmp4/MtxX [Candidatus Odinarchaeota archaeon]|nr:methanogenesis marker protein Mmp4/MtxX [Candidatus Odinarchaeota archaeon]